VSAVRASSISRADGLDVTRALQRVLYRSAKSDPRRRFHALFDHVARSDILWRAWSDVRAMGGPGADGVSVGDVEDGGVGSFCDGLADRLRSGCYRSAPLRRVYIPKAGETRRDASRPLSIPTVADRVVMTAAKIVLEPVFEADFSAVSFGFRPKRSAIEGLCRATVPGLSRARPPQSLTFRRCRSRRVGRDVTCLWPSAASERLERWRKRGVPALGDQDLPVKAGAMRAELDRVNAIPLTVEEIEWLPSEDLFDRVLGRVFTVVDGDPAALRRCDPRLRAWYLLRLFEGDVMNGGLHQFFCNNEDEEGWALVVEAYRYLGLAEMAGALDEVILPIAREERPLRAAVANSPTSGDTYDRSRSPQSMTWSTSTSSCSSSWSRPIPTCSPSEGRDRRRAPLTAITSHQP
jgi:hypothetical protein